MTEIRKRSIFGRLKLARLVFPFIALFGCSTPNRAVSSQAVADALTLTGEWSSQCYALPKRHSVIFQVKFSDGKMSAKGFQFADNACQVFNLTVSLQSDYSIGVKSGEGNEIHFTPKSITITIFHPEALHYYNLKKSCGISDWTLGQEKELINRTCEPTVVPPSLQKSGVDIFNVVDAQLLFGNFPFGFSQTLPSQLSHALPMKRMTGNEAELVSFRNKSLALHGLLYKPEGNGPFPVVLYNHGSAPGMTNTMAADILGPLYVKHGWAFFMPYRRGQGLSISAGPYIGDEIDKAKKAGGINAAQEKMVALLSHQQLEDQLAALSWLKTQPFVQTNRIAVAGNSFGGIETILGAERANYCGAVDASGGAESWADAPALRKLMTRTVKKSKAPILFFQAQNDYDTSPSEVLSKAMTNAGKISDVKIYPAFGSSDKDGHSFAYMGSEVWESDVFHFLEQYCHE